MICFYSVFQGELKFSGVSWHPVIKPHNTCITQLDSSVNLNSLFQVLLFIVPNKIVTNNFLIYYSGSFCVSNRINLCFFDDLLPAMTQFDPATFVFWQEKQEKLIKITRKVKRWIHKQSYIVFSLFFLK